MSLARNKNDATAACLRVGLRQQGARYARVINIGIKICLLRYTRRDSLRDRLSGKRISSTVRNNLDKGGSGIANADYFNPVARNLASLTRIKLLCKSAADAEYVLITGGLRSVVSRCLTLCADRRRMTLRPYAAFASARGSKECAMRSVCLLEDLRLVR